MVKGAEIEALKAKLEKLCDKKVHTKALEIKNPNKVAQLVAENIATSIEKSVWLTRELCNKLFKEQKKLV